MSKKLSLKAIITALFSIILLSSCTTSIEDVIINEYNTINSKVNTISQEITVSSNSVVLVEKDIVYSVTEGTKTVTSKTLNNIDEDEVYSIKTETVNASVSEAALSLSSQNLVSATITASGDLSAKIANSSIKSVLGIESSKVNGDVSILFDVDLNGENVIIDKVIITYKSVNGNDVVVTTSYIYK